MRRELEELLERAEEFLEAAKLLAEVGLLHAAFDDARHAAELAGKALLFVRTGAYPRKHQIAGELAGAGLIPADLDPKRVSRVLGSWTIGRYGFADDVGEEDVRNAIDIAEALLQANRE